MALIGNFRSQMLWENIRKGDLSAVVNLLENGTINLEERDENGQTFLMVACQQGEISLARELLDAGIDPNATDNDNWTALLYAAKDGHLEICIELLERDADIEHRDLCNWTALMWASYKGRDEVVQELLDRDADPNIKAEHNMSCLGWASGRGHLGVVKALVEKGARVNSTDKYGTTPLIWACRKGHADIVTELLQHGAYVDNTGMDSLTAVLVATKGGFAEVVQALLEHDPNVNAVDKDGFTALTIAAKEGYEDIVQELLAKDAYVNIADRVGDTILIHAVKGGYTGIVRALLNRYADLDVEGNERKTALYWAVEKSHPDIVKLLLENDADMEISTKDGDTPLMRAVRNRNELIVRLLLDKGAKVAVYDKKGDTALHISLRARSKRITELLLRNPRNSRLLYRPNKSGETPYSIDAYHQKGILTQIHGHRQLNASDGENLLGYEIYSSSLADILSEPSLNTPITVGLYAKWGSGKSFLIGKLKNLAGIIWICSTRYNVHFCWRISRAIGKRLQILTLLLQILFCNPVSRISSSTDVPLVKFLFSENTKLTSVGGEKALAAMIAGLSESVEKEFGMVSSRLFGVLKHVSDSSKWAFTNKISSLGFFYCVIIVGISLLVTYKLETHAVNGVMIALACVVGLSLLTNIHNIGRAFLSMIIPPETLEYQGLQAKKQRLTKSVSTYELNHESPTHNHKSYRRKDSTVSGFSLCEAVYQHQDSTVSQISGFSVIDPSIKKGRSKPRNDSLTQVTHSNFDISHTLTKNDYFSDINPKSMRRLMNIVAVTGRLLRAYNIDFNWYRLAAWVNLVEQWPYRLSWCILFFEEHDDLNDDVTLKFIYDKIEGQMPSSSEVEPLLEIDRNVRKLQVFLGSKSASSPMLSIADLKKFLPCTINLDPYLRKLIRNLQQQLNQSEIPMNIYSQPPNLTPSKPNQESNPYLKSSLHRTPGKQPIGAVYPGHMMQYGPMMYPHLMGMQNPYMMGMGMAGSSHHRPVAEQTESVKKFVNPRQYITGYTGEVLSKLNTEEVSNLLARIGGINLQQLPIYQEAVVDNNINGMVLTDCDLDDLGKCLQMKFGDWQLFRTAVKSLRDAEVNLPEVSSQDDIEIRPPATKKSKSSSDNVPRTIHFSNSDTNSPPESKNSAEQVRSRGKFRRQSTVDTEKSSNSAFDAIEEEINDEEEEMKARAKPMKRNDSVVAQMMYESSLLNEFVHNFTENNSGEDDNFEGESDEEMFPNGDVVRLIRPDSDIVQTSPVEFSLSVEHHFDDENQSPISNSQDSENEPLLAHAKSGKKSTGFSDPASSMNLSTGKTAIYDESSRGKNVHSEPNLMHHERQHLLKSSKTLSSESSGFADTSLYPQTSVSDSLDCLSLIDETQESKQGTSLEESIQMYTMQKAEGSSSATDGQFNSERQLITSKDGKGEEKLPSDFV
ncbi:kinase D-interacting substrate of 220 kDa B-like [Ruditapes philippinarum]|uniref:kinase D-interacting substrate of 220 kDa B-like n=1 Tax=Ruditapes philippinarum TaxID=129788 RepID=UPI00295B804C|nr:kinase D-interacting substrate of 220 kDa B-like [Ruditapes philippinarum]